MIQRCSPDGIPNLTFNAANNQITTSNANGQYEYERHRRRAIPARQRLSFPRLR